MVSTEVYRWYLRVASSQTGLPPQLELSGGDSPYPCGNDAGSNCSSSQRPLSPPHAASQTQRPSVQTPLSEQPRSLVQEAPPPPQDVQSEAVAAASSRSLGPISLPRQQPSSGKPSCWE